MMMDCPRCGFSQPKDQYCASCGLDVENFKPAKPALLLRFFSSTEFQVGTVAIVAVLMISWIYKDKLRHLENQIAQIPVIAKFADSAGLSAVENEMDAQVASEAPSTPAPAAPTTTTPAADIARPVAVGRSASAEVAPATPVGTLSMRFALVRRERLSQLTSRAKTLAVSSSTDRMASYKMKLDMNQLENDGDLLWLSGDSTASEGSPLMLNFTVPDNDTQFIGMVLQVGREDEASAQLASSAPGVEGEAKAENTNRFTMEGNLKLKVEGTPRPETIEKSFSGAFELVTDETILITGLLPYRKISAEDLGKFAGTPLTVLATEEYLSRAYEFVAVVQGRP